MKKNILISSLVACGFITSSAFATVQVHVLCPNNQPVSPTSWEEPGLIFSEPANQTGPYFPSLIDGNSNIVLPEDFKGQNVKLITQGPQLSDIYCRDACLTHYESDPFVADDGVAVKIHCE